VTADRRASTSPRPPPEASRSLRNSFLLLGTGLSCLILLLVTALVLSVSSLATLASQLQRTLRLDRAAIGIQGDLFRSARSHQLFGETGEARWERDAKESEYRLAHWLDVARELPKSPEVAKSFARLDATIEGLRREVLAAPPARRTLRWHEYLDAEAAATAFLDAIEKNSEVPVQHADRWSRIAIVLALASSVAVTLCLASVVGFVRRGIYLPIVRLRRALECHARDPAVRVPVAGAREIQAIGADVNTMIEALAAQREQRLTFLAGVAHDLRNPMTALRTSAQLAERKAETEAQRRQAGLVVRQVDRMNRLVGDLLDVTRIEAGQFELRFAAADLREVVREVCALYGEVSEGHEIRCRLPDEAVRASFDATRISQVLGNLVGNAIKYSPGGGPVDVSLAVREAWAILEVTDAGLGIPARDQASIFDPFRRSSGAAGRIPGVGLGLSVARRLVRAHHGEIEFESAVGEGSTFRVRLPLGTA
jgi:signal transduction histidine kinase